MRRVITRFNKDNVVKNQPLLDMLKNFSEKKKCSMAQISLSWMLKKSPVIIPIPGMRTDARIEENLSSVNVELTDEEYDNIEKELREKASEYFNNFMNERSEKIASKKKENENKELEFLNNKKLLKEGKLNPWEAVTENIAMKDSEYKGSRDISRMREVIINRKNEYVKRYEFKFK